MATAKQRRAARQNIKKAQQRWQEMTHAERVMARPEKFRFQKTKHIVRKRNRNV